MWVISSYTLFQQMKNLFVIMWMHLDSILSSRQAPGEEQQCVATFACGTWQWCAWPMMPLILSYKCSRLLGYSGDDLQHYLQCFIPLSLLLCFALTVQLHKIKNVLSVKWWRIKVFCGNYILDLGELILEGYFRNKLSSQSWGKEERDKL